MVYRQSQFFKDSAITDHLYFRIEELCCFALIKNKISKRNGFCLPSHLWKQDLKFLKLATMMRLCMSSFRLTKSYRLAQQFIILRRNL